MSVETALRNYRVAAWVTGIGLLILVFVAMPMKYFFDRPGPVAIVGVTHGFLYMVYILCTLILAERCRWKPLDAVLILLAGTIPVASFVAERAVTRRVRAGGIAATRPARGCRAQAQRLTTREGQRPARARPAKGGGASARRSRRRLGEAERATDHEAQLGLQLLDRGGGRRPRQPHVVVGAGCLDAEPQAEAVHAERPDARTLHAAQRGGQVPCECREHLGMGRLEVREPVPFHPAEGVGPGRGEVDG